MSHGSPAIVRNLTGKTVIVRDLRGNVEASYLPESGYVPTVRFEHVGSEPLLIDRASQRTSLMVQRPMVDLPPMTKEPILFLVNREVALVSRRVDVACPIAIDAVVENNTTIYCNGIARMV